MQTALHIYALTAEMKNLLVGATFTSTEFYKKEREAYLFFKAGKGHQAFGFAYHPVGFGAFMIPRGKMRIETKEKPWPFFQPSLGGIVTEIRQYDLDRIVRIEIEKDKARFAIVLEALGPNGNIWLVGENDVILATLRNKKYDSGQSYEPPPPIDKLNPLTITNDDILKISASESDVRLDAFLRKHVLGLDAALIDEIIERAELDEDMAMDGLDEIAIDRLTIAIRGIALQFANYDTAYVYRLHTGQVVYPCKLKSIDREPEKYKGLSIGVFAAIRDNRNFREEVSQKQMVLDAVARYVKKQKRKLAKIESDLDNADNFDSYRKTAELIKINIPNLKKGMETAKLDDVYDEDKTITVKLDPALTPSENADDYFKKYRKAKDGLALLKRRQEITAKELASVETMHAELTADFESASERYSSEIAELLPSTVTKRDTAPRLPYRAYTLESGVTIYIGRDGEDNDRTTFAHAKPYELWFHASQCPGSHVVMKFPDKNFEPSKAEILETAAIAAYHSKARNSKTVPVIYTERKYVRKPRKAKPGLVTVEREKLVMVEPKKPE
ncbi:MAG: NFACT family protein [candidate division Zixibacteria bacterium]|nr:NFACT family protein [candidate division Zixibacteria bacterium]